MTDPNLGKKAASIAAAAAIDAAEERIEVARRHLATVTAQHHRAVARGTHLRRRTYDAVTAAEDALDAAVAHRATLKHVGIGSWMRAGMVKHDRYLRDGLDPQGRTPAEARAVAREEAARRRKDRERDRKVGRALWVTANVGLLGAPALGKAMTKPSNVIGAAVTIID
jgi:hypothetical protein